MPDIMFIKTSSLGDVIHHMAAVTEARRHRPDARILWVVEETYAPLVRLHPAVDEVIPVATRRWRRALLKPATWREMREVARNLRRYSCEAVIDAQGLLRSAIIARVASGPRHGYNARSIREPLASLFYNVRHAVSRSLHAIGRNRRLTGLALGYNAAGPLDFGLQNLRNVAPAAYAVLLHASARPEKQWPEDRWIAVGKLLQKHGLNPVLPWGTDEEKKRSERIAKALPGAFVPERKPLDAVARLIAGASLVVGLDTGLLHLAAALGIPLVAIFTGSEPSLTGPMGAGPVSVIGGKSTAPPVGEVIEAVERTLGARAAAGPT